MWPTCDAVRIGAQGLDGLLWVPVTPGRDYCEMQTSVTPSDVHNLHLSVFGHISICDINEPIPEGSGFLTW